MLPVATSSAAAAIRTNVECVRRSALFDRLCTPITTCGRWSKSFAGRTTAPRHSTEVVVDVGSNIGISALYFLTRNPVCRCHLYEPDPRNLARLKANLVQFSGRWRLHEAAVGPKAGLVEFGREPTGRYGAVGARTPDVIRVPCLEIDAVLEEVLAQETKIDVLKIDTEGLEEPTVAAIHPNLLDRIETIYFESERPAELHGNRFDFSFANQTVRLRRRPHADALTDR